MPDSTIDIELPEATWVIIRRLALEEGISTNEFIVKVAVAYGREVLARHAETL